MILFIKHILFKSADLDIMAETVWTHAVKTAMWRINATGWLVCVMEDVSPDGRESHVIREKVYAYAVYSLYYFGLKWTSVNWGKSQVHRVRNKNLYVSFPHQICISSIHNTTIDTMTFGSGDNLSMNSDNFDFRQRLWLWILQWQGCNRRCSGSSYRSNRKCYQRCRIKTKSWCESP